MYLYVIDGNPRFMIRTRCHDYPISIIIGIPVTIGFKRTIMLLEQVLHFSRSLPIEILIKTQGMKREYSAWTMHLTQTY